MQSHRYECDVFVLGGGMAGCMAAIAASRSGARVLLAERSGFLGGAATAGSVSQFVGWSTRAGRQVVRGLADEVIDVLRKESGAGDMGRFVMSTGNVMDRIEYDADLLKIVLDRMTTDAGASVVFHSMLAAVSKEQDSVRSVHLAVPGGVMNVRAAAFVDASGDMALLDGSGSEFLPDDDASRQPATMMFSMAPVDFERLNGVTRDEKTAIIAQGLAAGDLARAALHHSRVPGSDVAWFNISRVVVDPSDPFSLSAGEMEGRRQALRISRFLRSALPGCENARLNQIAPMLGIRDTRRMAGDHVLTVEELRQGASFTDTVACGAYPVDIHHGDSPELTFEEFGEDHFYRIPYRSMLPAGLGNVAAAGRGISAEREAFAALRVMPNAMAMGHAVGIAAHFAASRHAGAFRDVSVPELQDALRRQNAFLGN
ncbi:MAG: membrane protein [Rhizobiaceae bacterium MnEN-MB40S]|nr:MAG: membrane protein [Rhizobiaceae bacterium MnEN-MB40S]